MRDWFDSKQAPWAAAAVTFGFGALIIVALRAQPLGI